MIIISIFSTLYENILQTTWLEGIAVSAGLLSVWFEKKENVLLYPVGIVNVLIYVYITYNVKLYADTMINAYYFVMSVYGWYHWTRQGTLKIYRPISRIGKKELVISLSGFIISFAILSYLLKYHTDSNVPYWDALTTSLFIVGMWLMALKKIENWFAWILGDFICIPLFAYKGLVLTSIQFAVFTTIAILGYIEWNKKMRTEMRK